MVKMPFHASALIFDSRFGYIYLFADMVVSAIHKRSKIKYKNHLSVLCGAETLSRLVPYQSINFNRNGSPQMAIVL